MKTESASMETALTFFRNGEAKDFSEFISMYEIPGQEKITQRMYLRYQRQKAALEPEIIRLARARMKEMTDQKKTVDPFAVLYQEMQDLPKSEWGSFIALGLSEEDIERRLMYSLLISFVPSENERILLGKRVVELIEERVGLNDTEALKAYAETIPSLSSSLRADLVHKYLANEDIGVQRSCARMIGLVPKTQRFALLKEGLAKEDAELQKKCAVFIGGVPEGEQRLLRSQIKMLIERGLAKDDIEIQKTYARMIRYAPEEVRAEFLRTAQNRLGDRLVEPLLYKDVDIAADVFLQRRKFVKTGSGTTLAGGNLKGKSIIRHIEPSSFIVWQKLYENNELWREEGFVYVPIEPIQSFRINRQGLVDVFSGVLDLSLQDWCDMGGNFLKELIEDAARIESVLRRNGFIHGHTHYDNFCLKFFRDEEGRVDYQRKPRIYLIDFDLARVENPSS